MGRDKQIEKELIIKLAEFVQDETFIINSLLLLNSDSKRKALLKYLEKNQKATKKEIETEMFYITINERG